MTLTLPLPPNIANMRAHWARKNTQKRQYWEHCGLWRAVHRQPRPPVRPPLTADVTVTLYTHQRMDDDNAAARCKWLLDWLVGDGYLLDDKRPYCMLTVCQQVDRKRQRACVEIT